MNKDLWLLQKYTGSKEGWEVAVRKFKEKHSKGKPKKFIGKFAPEYLVGPWKNTSIYLSTHLAPLLAITLTLEITHC